MAKKTYQLPRTPPSRLIQQAGPMAADLRSLFFVYQDALASLIRKAGAEEWTTDKLAEEIDTLLGVPVDEDTSP